MTDDRFKEGGWIPRHPDDPIITYDPYDPEVDGPLLCGNATERVKEILRQLNQSG